MVVKETTKAANPAAKKDEVPAKKVEKAVTKQSKSLAYGKVNFKAMLTHGKWRFINKAEAEKCRKQKLAKLEKLKAAGKEISVKVSVICVLLMLFNSGYIAQVTCARFANNC